MAEWKWIEGPELGVSEQLPFPRLSARKTTQIPVALADLVQMEVELVLVKIRLVLRVS